MSTATISTATDLGTQAGSPDLSAGKAVADLYVPGGKIDAHTVEALVTMAKDALTSENSNRTDADAHAAEVKRLNALRTEALAQADRAQVVVQRLAFLLTEKEVRGAVSLTKSGFAKALGISNGLVTKYVAGGRLLWETTGAPKGEVTGQDVRAVKALNKVTRGSAAEVAKGVKALTEAVKREKDAKPGEAFTVADLAAVAEAVVEDARPAPTEPAKPMTAKALTNSLATLAEKVTPGVIGTPEEVDAAKRHLRTLLAALNSATAPEPKAPATPQA